MTLHRTHGLISFECDANGHSESPPDWDWLEEWLDEGEESQPGRHRFFVIAEIPVPEEPLEIPASLIEEAKIS